MLYRTFRLCSKRSAGYVFWRQSTLVELEKARRTYQAGDRTVPIGEIARRMARVKSRYEATRDFHERTLLRGEYKYFTGKMCDTRAAQLGDLIAFIQCAAFFGFWDAAQVERVMRELHLKRAALTPNEMACLFVALPGVRKQESELFRQLAEDLVAAVPDLTVEECLRVLSASAGAEDAAVPVELTHNCLVAIEAELDTLSAPQMVDVMDALSVTPAAVQGHFTDAFARIKIAVVARCDELDDVELAVLYTALCARPGECDTHAENEILGNFVQKSSSCTARSAAMMFTAVANSHTAALSFAQAMESRVIFLATDFTTPELLAVMQVYLSAFAGMSVIAHSHTTALASSALATVSSTGSSNSNDGGSSSSDSVMRCAVKAELSAALQRATSIRHVLAELTAQLVVLLDSAAAFVSATQQLQVLEMYASTLEELAELPDPVSVLLQQQPNTESALRLLNGKLIASARRLSALELVRLLQLADALGPRLVRDALVTAVVQELTVRDLCLSSAEAAELSRVLGGLEKLRAEHQRRITESLVPKLRQAV